METVKFDYSLKNIPIPDKNSYLKSLLSKVTDFIFRMRWKAIFYDNPEDNNRIHVETYGFKTEKTPQIVPALTAFENDLHEMVQNIKFNNKRTDFQTKLSKDIQNIKKCKNIIVAADKSSNMYKMTPNEHNKLITDNVTNNYKIADTSLLKELNAEAMNIATDLKLEKRIECIATNGAFVKIKDHKPNFQRNTKCRLLNPTKTEIGKISKELLQKINETIRRKTSVNQWRSTSETLKWFKEIEEKQNTKFIQLDIVDYYPSISEKLLTEAIEFAETKTNISAKEKHIIFHARKSVLSHNDKIWVKTLGSST